jgi:hypothetical protein
MLRRRHVRRRPHQMIAVSSRPTSDKPCLHELRDSAAPCVAEQGHVERVDGNSPGIEAHGADHGGERPSPAQERRDQTLAIKVVETAHITMSCAKASAEPTSLSADVSGLHKDKRVRHLSHMLEPATETILDVWSAAVPRCGE